MTAFEPARDARPNDRAWPEMVWPDPTVALINPFVQLTRATTEDVPDLFAALDDERVWEHIPTRPATGADWAEAIATAEDRGRVIWVVRHPGGEVVGASSYLEIAPVDARLEIGATTYSPAVWGTTVNPAVKLLLLGHAFEDLNVGRVQLKTDVRNERSQRAIARLGATFEGVLRRYQRRSDDTVRDTALFSITAEQWPAVRSGLLARLPAAG